MFWKDLTEQARLATGDFAKLFGKIDIPPLSHVAGRLQELVRQPDVQLAQIGQLLASDAGISIKILKAVNSARFGLARQVSDVSHPSPNPDHSSGDRACASPATPA